MGGPPVAAPAWGGGPGVDWAPSTRQQVKAVILWSPGRDQPGPAAPPALGAGQGGCAKRPSLVFQELYRKDCNLAAQLLQSSQTYGRVRKVSEVTWPRPKPGPAPSRDHPAPFGPPHPEASPHPPGRSYRVSLNPRPSCTWVPAS